MNCPTCNTVNREGASFCLKCGLRLAVSTAPAAYRPPVEQQPPAGLLPETQVWLTSQAAPYQPPAMPVYQPQAAPVYQPRATPVASTAMRRGAGFGVRTGAYIIDGIIFFVLSTIGGFFAGLALALLTPEIFADGLLPNNDVQLLTLAGGMLVQILYRAQFEGLASTTPGKLILGLRVSTLDGRPIGLGSALVRQAAILFDGLFFGLIAYSAMKDDPQAQRYGDRWAKTIVITKADYPHWSDKSMGAFALALLIGFGLLIVQTAIITYMQYS